MSEIGSIDDRLSTEAVLTQISCMLIDGLKYQDGPQAVGQFLDMVESGEITLPVLCRAHRRAMRHIVDEDTLPEVLEAARVFEECQAARTSVFVLSSVLSETIAQTLGNEGVQPAD